MRVVFLGSSHGIPEANRRCSCALVEVGENLFDYHLTAWGVCINIKLFERREQAVVHEVKQYFAGEGVAVGIVNSPIAPT